MPPVRPFQVSAMLALSAVGYVYFSGVTANGQTVSVGATTYEFNDGAPTPGNVQVNVPNGSNAAVSTAGLVAAINAHAAGPVDAFDAGGDVTALVLRTPGATNPALAKVGGNIAVSAANMTGGTAEGRLALVPGQYTVTAQDVTTLASMLGTAEIPIGAFPSTTQPRLLSIIARRAGSYTLLSNGVIIARQVNTNYWALFYAEPAGGALLQANDILDFILAVPGV